MRMSSFMAAALAGLLLTATPACVIRGRGEVTYYVDEDPPEPQREVVQVRPGFIWIQGYWFRDGKRWVWIDGHFVGERADADWVPGVWVRSGGRWRWNPGRWAARQRRKEERRERREERKEERREEREERKEDRKDDKDHHGKGHHD